MNSQSPQQQRLQVHLTLMQEIESITQKNKKFDPFIHEFAKGVDDSAHYNRALRRLCTLGNDEKKVIPLIKAIFKQRLYLKISPDEKNKEGFSAIDYAKEKNFPVYELMMTSIKADMESIVAPQVSEMASTLASKIDPSNAAKIKNANTGSSMNMSANSTPPMTAEQQAILQSTTAKTMQMLMGMLTNPVDIHSMTPQQRHTYTQGLTAGLLKNLAPDIQRAKAAFPQQNTDIARDDETLSAALTRLSGDDILAEPFCEYCVRGEYENALRYAATCTSSKMGPLVHAVLTKTDVKVDEMKDAMDRTPLHDAAIASNWGVYFTLCSKGNSALEDKLGISAQDYRRKNQINQIRNGSNLVGELLNSALPTAPRPK